MRASDLRNETVLLIHKHPEHKQTLIDFYQLALSEIDEGGSEMHECELAYNDMLEVVNSKPTNIEI